MFRSEDVRNERKYCTVSDAGGGELTFLIVDANKGVIDFGNKVGKLNITKKSLSHALQNS